LVPIYPCTLAQLAFTRALEGVNHQTKARDSPLTSGWRPGYSRCCLLAADPLAVCALFNSIPLAVSSDSFKFIVCLFWTLS